jgi:hypothetical protein
MPLGLVTGLAAALSWGTLDLFSALASRRIGSLQVTTGMQIVGAILIALLAIATGTRVPTDPFVLIGAPSSDSPGRAPISRTSRASGSGRSRSSAAWLPPTAA